MNEREQIIELIKQKPKHVTQIIKRDDRLSMYVSDNKRVSSAIYAEEVYSAIYPETTNICPNNNLKKFKSIKAGYAFCGRANSCECARKSVSDSVSASKSKFTDNDILNINRKREATNIKKYGVSNVGQTAKAKANHQAYYADDNNVSKTVKQIEQTKLDNWGNKHYNNSQQISSTWRQKSDNEKQRITKQRLKTYADKYGDKSLHLLQSWYDKLCDFFETHYDVSMLTSKEEYVGVSNQQYYEFKCNKCEAEFTTYIDNGHPPICKKCNPSPKSQPEQDIHDWLVMHGIDHEMNNKTILDGKELDIYIPEKNIAIEYCGLYWHSDFHSRIDKWYHYDKWKQCRDKNIHLITIFSDQWVHKRDIVLKRLETKLKINVKSIGARKTRIRELTNTEEKEFFLFNHIQGYNPSRVAYGLIENGEIVAAMSFKKVRYHSKDLSKDDWELLRFASCKNVQGGASKLFRHFIKTVAPSKIVSYSDNDWNTGGLYEQLGFTLSRISGPSYWYANVNDDIRYHRFNFRKKDTDPDMPENQRVFESHKYLRFWDTGNTRWIWQAS
jgi:hypothetical protein